MQHRHISVGAPHEKSAIHSAGDAAVRTLAEESPSNAAGLPAGSLPRSHCESITMFTSKLLGSSDPSQAAGTRSLQRTAAETNSSSSCAQQPVSQSLKESEERLAATDTEHREKKGEGWHVRHARGQGGRTSALTDPPSAWSMNGQSKCSCPAGPVPQPPYRQPPAGCNPTAAAARSASQA